MVSTVHATRLDALDGLAGSARVLGAVLRCGLLSPRPDTIVCVSHGVADDLAVATGERRDRMRVIYNPVIDERMLALAREPSNTLVCTGLRLPWFWRWADWLLSRIIRGFCGHSTC